MKLHSNQLCPIHRFKSCCGRAVVAEPKFIRLGVQRIEDPHHPKGIWKIVDQNNVCPICNEEFTEYAEAVEYTRLPRHFCSAQRCIFVRRLSSKIGVSHESGNATD